MLNERIYYKNPNREANILIGKRFQKSLVADIHVHPELEFIYVFSGKIMLSTESQSFIGEKDEIIFIDGSVPHSTEFLENDTQQGLVQFRKPSTFRGAFKYLSHFLRQSSVNVHVFKKDSVGYENVHRSITGMLNTYKSQKISDDYLITSFIYSILSTMYENDFLVSEENLIDFKLTYKLAPVFEYINTNFQENLTLESLAKILALNKDYFCRIFKKATGTTVIDYINFVRICKAKELFDSDMNLSEIAYSVGFSSLSYFNCIFKKYNSLAPSQYRNLIKQSDKHKTI